MQQGWISLHRQLLDHRIWNEKPFSRGQAWVDLLLSANHKPATLIYGNTIIELGRGQLHTSELKLAARWGWSKKKVRAYLGLLKGLGMVTTQATTKGTTLTIENYAFYQDRGTTQGTTKDTDKEPRRNREGYTNNNDNNEKQLYPPEFELFFSQYPNPSEKRRTFTNWNKAIKSSTAEEILAASRNYANETKGREKQFIKTSSNFLGRDQIYKDYLVREEKPKVAPREIIIKEIDR